MYLLRDKHFEKDFHDVRQIIKRLYLKQSDYPNNCYEYLTQF